MLPIEKTLIAILLFALLAMGWMFRWQVIEVHGGNYAAAYLVNRWTGEVRYLNHDESELVTEVRAKK